MRMALCIYGQVRTAEFCASSVQEHLISRYSPDVFLCSDSSGDVLKDLYHPVRICIHTNDEFLGFVGERIHRYGEKVPNPGPYKNYPILPSGDLSFMYKAWRCREMLWEYGKKYDVIVGTRFDAKFLNVQPITIPKKNTYYIPRVDAFGKEADKNGIHWGIGYCTHIWWSEFDIGMKMLDAYHWTDDLYKQTKVWSGETMVKKFCDNNHINVEYTDVDFMLIRGDSRHPREGLPPWGLLSKTNHPEYLPSEWNRVEVKKEVRELPW